MSKFFTDNTFSFVDIETNGMSPTDGKIIEIAIVQVQNHEIIRKYETLVNPGEDYIPWFIENMTGINIDMLQGKPTFREIAEEVYELLEGTVFVAHNVAFDHGFIHKKLKREMFDLHTKRICTVKISRKLNPHFSSHKLDSLIQMLDIQVESRHRAMDDVEVLVKYYQYLLETHGEDELVKILLKHMH